jgi:HSP20 family protein
MATQRIDPIKEFANLRDTVSRAIGQSIQTVTGAVYPFLDMYETEESVIIITSPIDGIVRESLEVAMEDDLLTITGKTNPTEDIAPDSYLLRERRFGEFVRTVRVPRAVNAEAAQAKFTNGMLTVTLPKIPRVGAQTIEVSEDDKPEA